MVYLQGVAEQTRLFLLSVGFGFLLGIFYDLFRTVRLIILDSRAFVLFMDLLYSVFCTFLNFCFILAFDYGEVRIYTVLGEILGWLIYYFSFGAIAIRVSRAISRAAKRIVLLILKPFIFIKRKIKRSVYIILKILKKLFRKSTKKTKFSLQKQQGMVYNLRGYLEKCTRIKIKRN